jgi:hypothetical protein
VAETDSTISGLRAMTAEAMDVFPAPEGPDMTRSFGVAFAMASEALETVLEALETVLEALETASEALETRWPAR